MPNCLKMICFILLLTPLSCRGESDTEKLYGVCFEYPMKNEPLKKIEFSNSLKFCDACDFIKEPETEIIRKAVLEDTEIKYMFHKSEKHVVIAPDPGVYTVDDTMEKKFTISFSADSTIYDSLVQLVQELNNSDSSCSWLSLRGNYEHYQEEFPECYWQKLGRDLSFKQLSVREIFLELLAVPTDCQIRYAFGASYPEEGGSGHSWIELNIKDKVKPEKYRRLNPEKLHAGVKKYVADFPEHPPKEWLDARKDKCAKVDVE